MNGKSDKALGQHGLGHLLEVGQIGAGHDADVHMDDAVAADPHDLPLLQGPQQLDLKGGAHALHLVQKQL